MAEKQCPDCKMMIDKSARVCPHCRKRFGLTLCAKMTLAFFAFIVLAYLVNDFRNFTGMNNNSSVDSPNKERTISDRIVSPQTNRESLNELITMNGYTLSRGEGNLLKNLLFDDIVAWLEGRKSAKTLATIWDQRIHDLNAIRVSSDTLQTDYEQNEVRADSKYKERLLIVHGVVTSINRGMGDDHYLTLRGGSNTLMETHANMSDGFLDYIVGLEKGNTAYLFCQGNGMVLGSAMLSQCRPIEDLATREVNNFFSGIDKRINEKDISVMNLIFGAVTFEASLSKSSDCFVYDKDSPRKCASEMNNITTKPDYQSKVEEAKIIAAKKLNYDPTHLTR
jgi:hypothetical protein